MKDIDHEYTDNIVCPYCGYEDHDSWESERDWYPDMECMHCERQFKMSRITTVKYVTEKIEK
jgi:DNA-directed RNA polymerase subunit RPC12/RpoP